MTLLKQVAIFVLSLSFAVFITFFGRLPIFRKTPIGFLHRSIWIHIPNGLTKADQRLSGGRVGSGLKRTGHYLFYERHPIVLIFFFLLLVISELLFLQSALPLLATTFPSNLLYSLHCLLISSVTIPPYILLYLANRTSSIITPDNHLASMQTYPYDHNIFHPPTSPLAHPPHARCPTCTFTKPARSKHCSICGFCIQKADHHCVWIDNCVGRNNYVYFLGLMGSVSLLLAYGAWLGYKIFDMQLQLQDQTTGRRKPSMVSHHWSKSLAWSAYSMRWSSTISTEPLLAAPTLLALLTFPLAAGLTLYHVYLVWAGMTTNESSKWDDLREDIGDGIVWRATLDEVGEDVLTLDQGTINGGQEGRIGLTWPIKPKWVVLRMEEAGQRPRIRRRSSRPAGGEGSREPMHGATVSASHPPDASWQEDLRWSTVSTLSEVENIYDLGFCHNLKDVFWNRE